MVLETTLRAGIVVVLVVVLVFVWHLDGRGRWRETLTDRFLLGVPWGSLVSILLVLFVYLFVQSGLESWGDPAVLPFRSWSYSYVLGLLAAGFSHAGPGHLLNNLLATLVLAPLVEFAWGHRLPGGRGDSGRDTDEEPSDSDGSLSDSDEGSPDRSGEESPETGRPATGAGAADPLGGGAAGNRDNHRGPFERPPVRALVVFPLALVGVSVLTSVFARGFSLGYSGTVFFLLGVAVVMVPLATIVGMVALTGVTVVFRALQTPVLQVTAAPGGPGPPSWAGVNVQAHLVGFLLGVLLAFALLRHRDRWPDTGRLALAFVLVVLVRGLWSYATSSGDVYTRWQGVGVIFVLFLAALVVAMVSVEDERVVGSLTLRGVVVAGVVAITVVLALASVPPNITGMDDDPVPDTAGISVQDYTVTYAEAVPHGRFDIESSGVIVVSEQRDLWSSVAGPDQLAHSGNATATVGGVGWRETVHVARSGWDVVGNDTAYAVDLEHKDRQVRAFQSGPKRADARLAGHALSVVPTADGFGLRVVYENETVGERAIPPANETRTVALDGSGGLEELSVGVEKHDDGRRLVVEHENTRVPVANAEG
jgi:membrane associated rhomboid family serine protease